MMNEVQLDLTELDLTEIVQRLARGQVDTEVLLALLAAAGSANAPHASRAAGALRDHANELQPVWGELVDWVRDWPSPPDEAVHFRSWLFETELLGLAREALVLPEFGARAEGLSDSLVEALDRFRVRVDERRDHARFAGLAEQRRQRLGRSVPPWSWLRSGEVLALLSESDGPRAASELWIDGLLHSADALVLASEVRNDATLRSAYAGLLRARLARVELTQWTAAWSLDVARSDAELDFVPPLLHVPLPHLDGAITIWQHEAGAYWRGPAGPLELLAADVTRHTYSIPGLGDFATEWVRHSPSQAQNVWHGLASLRRVADDRFTDEVSAHERLGLRAEELVDTVVSAFESGVLHEALRDGHDAFERGAETSEDLDCLVRYALEARLELSLALRSLTTLGRSVGELSERLAAADERLRACSSAVLLIDERDYRDLLEGVPLDRSAWWATRRVLDERVPMGVVEDALMERSQDAAKGAQVFAFPRRSDRRVFISDAYVPLAAADAVTVPTEPCRWLFDEHADGPEVGQVPLLLFDASTGEGVVAQLSVSRAEPAPASTVWRDAEMLGEIARTAIQDAYWATGKLCRAKFPPSSFSEHRFRLVLPISVKVNAVEGSSVGVAAALAFASLWAQTPVPRDLATTASVTPSGSLHPVGHVLEKATRLHQTSSERLRLVVAQQNVRDASSVAIDAIAAGWLEEVLALAGLALRQLEPPPVSSCEVRLNQLIRSVRTGNPDGRHALAWQDTANDLAWLVEVLSKRSTSSNLSEARCWAALAYLHAGARGSAQWILTGVDRGAIHRIEDRALFDVVEVDKAIDQREPNPDVLESLAHDIEELGQADPSSLVLGSALGTMGRAHLHADDAEGAIPWLKRAVKQHQEHQDWEAGRSRVYLSMALRLMGDATASLEQLVAADEDLRTRTRDYSPEYEGACRMYLEYERARVLLALERYEDAERAASEAEERARWTAWPLLGILRTRAWVRRMLGRDAEADHDVARMQGIDIDEWIKGPLVLEAKGYPFDGGEVY